MTYLKIFPRSLTVKTDGAGGYTGRMTYDFEHYGRIVYDDDSNIVLQCLSTPHANWLIQSLEPVHHLAGFPVFMNALNFYLFDVVQFDPVSQLSKVNAADYEYYFERVYFDMGTGKFASIKKSSVHALELKRAISSTNICS